MNNLVDINRIIGPLGKLISYSKSAYCQRNPDNLVVFNSNVCTQSEKIWFGDLDITLEKEKLIELSKALNETIYVLSEMDGRFENEKSPKIERAKVSIFPNGEIKLKEEYQKYYKL
jgi:hypothetical protein